MSVNFNIFTATGWICHKSGRNIISADPSVCRMKHVAMQHCIRLHQMFNNFRVWHAKHFFKGQKMCTTRKSVLSVSREASKCLTDSTVFGWLTCHVSSPAFQLLCATVKKREWRAICETVPVLWIHWGVEKKIRGMNGNKQQHEHTAGVMEEGGIWGWRLVGQQSQKKWSWSKGGGGFGGSLQAAENRGRTELVNVTNFCE